MIGRVLRLELRVQRVLELVARERHEGEREEYEAHREIAANRRPETTGRRHAGKCKRNEQVEPQPGRCTGFVIAECQRKQRDGTRGGAEQPEHRDRDDQDQEEIEQLPVAGPAADGTVGPRRREQLVAGRQVEVGPDVREARGPAGHRHVVPAFNPGQRRHVHVGPPEFDTRLAGLVAACHEQVGTGLARAREHERLAHVEPPVGLHSAADGVPQRETSAVEVEPQVAAQGQRILGRRPPAAALWG